MVLDKLLNIKLNLADILFKGPFGTWLFGFKIVPDLGVNCEPESICLVKLLET